MMTRINANIEPRNLTDQHLLAEHREIKRMCDMYSKRSEASKFDDIPQEFTLNKGHMTFFLDKGKFTHDRYKSLYSECLNRGFNVTNFSDSWTKYINDDQFYKGWESTEKDNDIIIKRIIERLKESKQTPRYRGQTISIVDAINNLIELPF